MPWIWLAYSLIFIVVIVWTAVLFFKRNSAAGWCGLIGAVILAVGSLIGSVIAWLGPFMGLDNSYSPATGEPAHFTVADLAWRASTAGMLCFQGAVWFILKRKNAASERIAELEAAIHGIQDDHSATPPSR
jgi:hypothetical protein